MGSGRKDSSRFRSLNQPKVYVQLDVLTENIPLYDEMKDYPENSKQHQAFVKYSNVVCKAVFDSLKKQFGYKIIFVRIGNQEIERDALDITHLAIQEVERMMLALAA